MVTKILFFAFILVGILKLYATYATDVLPPPSEIMGQLKNQPAQRDIERDIFQFEYAG